MTAPEGPHLSIRIDLPGGGRFGPGKAALLDAIADLGSINKAATHLGMSYPRAKKLVEAMNQDFGTPLVISAQGGADGGGSRLTEKAEEIRALYRELCKQTLAGNKALLTKFGPVKSRK